MYVLKTPGELFWMPLLLGVEFRVRPPATPIFTAARARSETLTKRLLEDHSTVKLLGGRIEALPDLSTETGRKGVERFIYVVCLACEATESWRGVTSEVGGETVAPLTEETMGQLMSDHRMSDAFTVKYHKDILAAADEGNGSRPAPNGTSQTAAGRATAKSAKGKPAPAREDSQGSTASSAPTTKTA